MMVRVLLFGPAAMAVRLESVSVELGPQRTCIELARAIGEQWPDLRLYVSRGRLAINSTFVDESAMIQESDEVALISMVSGG